MMVFYSTAYIFGLHVKIWCVYDSGGFCHGGSSFIAQLWWLWALVAAAPTRN
jgi:hypothetical protein